MWRLLFVGVLALATRSTTNAGDGPFVFSYFKGDGEDGLHLAWSEDGLKWLPLNGDRPLTSPQVGGKLMRDPSIVRGPDGVFHMVWSSGWWDLGFGYAFSKDLVHWSQHRFIPVNEKVKGAKNTWAPDLYFDKTSKRFFIVFATTVPGRFPETDQGGDHNHRQYWVSTTDFRDFTAPEIAFNPGHNSIDGTLFERDGELALIYKDERPGQKRLKMASTPTIGQPWKRSNEPILDRDWVEGPTVLRVGKVWRVYFDCYTKGHYGAGESPDGIHWRDISDQVSFPKGARHGTAFTVPEEILAGLRKMAPDGGPAGPAESRQRK